MRGVAAHYPAFDTGTGGPINLDQRINICREKNQEAEPFPWESEEILALSAFVGHQSRGMPVRVGDDSRLAGFLKAGEDAFHQKQGQLNFSCADCHDANWGKQSWRQRDPAGPRDRVPDLPSGMAIDGVASAALAQLHGGSPGGTLLLWLAGVCRAGALPDVAVTRHGGGDAGGSTVNVIKRHDFGC